MNDDFTFDLPPKINGVTVIVYSIIFGIVIFFNFYITLPVYQTFSSYVSIEKVNENTVFIKRPNNSLWQFPNGARLKINIHPANGQKDISITGIVANNRPETIVIKEITANSAVFPKAASFSDITLISDRVSIFQKIRASFIKTSDK